MIKLKYYITLLIFLFAIGTAQAQRKSRIKYQADELENFRVDGVKLKKLTGNVIFTHKSTIIHCDTSYFYAKENKMEAFGNVKILDGDSVTITSKTLIYLGDESKAYLRENVVYSNTKETLYTDFLDYDIIEKIASYYNGGKLVDSDNTLTSEIAIYYDRLNYAEFYKNVILYSQEYDMETDSLEYYTITKTGFTHGATKIITEDDIVINSEGGKFKTARKLTEFTAGEIESENYIIIGDELYFDDLRQVYTAIGHVKLTSKNDNIVIIGDKAIYDKNAGLSKVYGNPVMKKLMKLDTFYLSADTLIATENVDKTKDQILAYYDVKMFKSNLQGIADSLSYHQYDSMIYMFDDPVLWTKTSQLEADSIDILLSQEQIKKMIMRRNSFMVSKDLLGQYNQIKGRNMLSIFEDDIIQSVDVEGNGHSLYFVLEGDSLLLGMNNIYCSDMKIRFKDNTLNDITFYKSPEAKFIPPQKLEDTDQVLEGFNWRKEERPSLNDILYPTDSIAKNKIKNSIGKLENSLDKIEKTIDKLENSDAIIEKKKLLNEKFKQPIRD